MRRLLMSLIVFLWPLFAWSQISVSGVFEADTVEIGTPVKLTLSVLKPADIRIVAVYSNFIDSLYSAYQTLKNPGQDSLQMVPVRADYEVVSYGLWATNGDQPFFGPDQLKWDQTTSGQGTLVENTFQVVLWDPGENFTFLPPVLYQQDGEQKQFYEGGIVRIFVTAPEGMEEMSQDSLDLAPIKPIITEERNFSDFLGFVYGLVALILAAGLYFVYTRITRDRSQEIALPEPEPDPPHIIALEALQQLKDEKLWQAGEIKSYQSKLTYIIREYIENKYGIPALETTTDYIISEVQQTGLDTPLVNTLGRVLRIADLVKFAKAKPALDIHDEFMDEAIYFVNQTTSEGSDENEEDHDADSGEDKLIQIEG